MDPALNLKIQRAGWNKAAPHYDNLWQRQLKPAQDMLMEAVAIKPGETVLDTACGSGLVTFPIARVVGADGLVLGIDISEAMLGIARQQAEAYQLKNVRFEPMDAERLMLPDNHFDVAVCALGIMYLSDPVQALAEMYRVLKPGGRAAVLTWGARKNCGWASVFPIVDRRVTTDVCPLFFQQGTGHTLACSLEEVGFSDMQEKRLATRVHHNSADDACDAMFIGGPVALAWRHFDEGTRKTARKEYLESLAPFRNHHSYDVPAEFVVAVGIKN